ncbi:MAG: pyridoxal phosphate-dependent aminotransferase [candidate division Zixibacteria bacterium]|nr:pyridoxal phosphate-dependent aminotransferase [candidate division Zixibacteria bacterium]
MKTIAPVLPDISRRARLQPASPIRKLVPLADAAKRRGITVYHLNIGQPDLPPPPEFVKAVKNWNKPVLEYGNSKGDFRLISKVIRYYKQELDVDLREENVQITTGGSEALLFAMMAVAAPGDEIVVFEPFYTNYNGFAVMAGVSLNPVVTYGENGYHLPPEEEIEKHVNSRTRAILVCSPNNPTGTVYSKKEMEMVAELCRRHSLFLLSDEPYREFIYEGEFFSALHLKEMEEQVIVLDSASKRFSLCGARVGFLVSKNTEVVDAALRMGQARLSSPTIEQEAVTAAFDIPPDYFKKMAAEYKKRRDLLFARLGAMSGVSCEKPEGAFYLMARLPVEDAEDFCRWLLSDFSLQGETLMMAPGAGFYATPGAGKDEVRIAYVLSTDKLERATAILASGLEKFGGR